MDVTAHVMKVLSTCPELDDDIREYVAGTASGVLDDADASQATQATRQACLKFLCSFHNKNINKIYILKRLYFLNDK